MSQLLGSSINLTYHINVKEYSTDYETTEKAILEEKDAEPELLRNAIRKVIEARIRMNALRIRLKSIMKDLTKC